MRRITIAIVALLPSAALAKPTAPGIFCSIYGSSPLCAGGLVPCAGCHTTPPEHNVYGLAVRDALGMRDFDTNLADAITAVETGDADGDGFPNADEIAWGTYPGDPSSFPILRVCPSPDYDPEYALEKVALDVCGVRLTYEQKQQLAAASMAEKMDAVHLTLDACLDSEFWLGKNGTLWELAHRKIRPIGALKNGEDPGAIPVSDYYDDYNLFVYAQIDDHDVRDLLLGDYFVDRTSNPTTYVRVADKAGQLTQRDRRAGMMTTQWFLIYYVMFTAVPRTAAAQAYRSYLNLDIAKLQGLRPVSGEPIDWDSKGVTQEACVICHSTLDPLTYPFTRYEGFPGAQYNPNRMQQYLAEAPSIGLTPESGTILGQPVADLMEWANVAANSDEFAAATVTDYWNLLIGHPPAAEELPELERLWRGLQTKHAFSVERMLHDLVETEAYGVR